MNSALKGAMKRKCRHLHDEYDDLSQQYKKAYDRARNQPEDHEAQPHATMPRGPCPELACKAHHSLHHRRTVTTDRDHTQIHNTT